MVPRGPWQGVQQAALGSCPRALRRREWEASPKAGFGTGHFRRGLETRGLQKVPRRSRWALRSA